MLLWDLSSQMICSSLLLLHRIWTASLFQANHTPYLSTYANCLDTIVSALNPSKKFINNFLKLPLKKGGALVQLNLHMKKCSPRKDNNFGKEWKRELWRDRWRSLLRCRRQCHRDIQFYWQCFFLCLDLEQLWKIQEPRSCHRKGKWERVWSEKVRWLSS